LNAELAHISSLLGPAEEREHRGRLLEAALGEQRTRFNDLDGRTAKLRLAAPDLAGAEAALQRTRSVEEAANRERASLREKLAALNAHIRSRSDEAVEEAWRETGETLAAANKRVESFEKEVAVLARLRSALQDSRSQARDLYLQPVINE